MTTEERFQQIEENLRVISLNLTTASKMLVEGQERGDKLDGRIRAVLNLTLHIGADFSERIRALEERDGEE